jgi:hypothetical protein
MCDFCGDDVVAERTSVTVDGQRFAMDEMNALCLEVTRARRD